MGNLRKAIMFPKSWRIGYKSTLTYISASKAQIIVFCYMPAMETKIYKIMKWVKSYETISKIQFLLDVGFTALYM